MTCRAFLLKGCSNESPAKRNPSYREDHVKNVALVVAVFALPLVLAAFATGWTLSDPETKVPQPATPKPQPVASTAPTEDTVPQVIAEEDVPGKDLAGLPRYPGSTRVGYRQEHYEGFARTRAEYVTNAGSDEIRTFYRRFFASEGWVVADLGFSPEKWYFFVVKDEREALIEIHALRRPILVEIKLTGPERTSAAKAPTSSPSVRPPKPLPGDDEEKEGVDDYEGGDDRVSSGGSKR